MKLVYLVRGIRNNTNVRFEYKQTTGQVEVSVGCNHSVMTTLSDLRQVLDNMSVAEKTFSNKDTTTATGVHA
jgi:hypothetical protein